MPGREPNQQNNRRPPPVWPGLSRHPGRTRRRAVCHTPLVYNSPMGKKRRPHKRRPQPAPVPPSPPPNRRRSSENWRRSVKCQRFRSRSCACWWRSVTCLRPGRGLCGTTPPSPRHGRLPPPMGYGTSGFLRGRFTRKRITGRWYTPASGWNTNYGALLRRAITSSMCCYTRLTRYCCFGCWCACGRPPPGWWPRFLRCIRPMSNPWPG